VNTIRTMLDSSRTRWTLIALAGLVAFLVAAFGMQMLEYSLAAFGTLFKAALGGGLGAAFSKWGCKLDLSAIERDHRPVAAISQALLIGCGMIAGAVGV
jgi:hypothetical protein